MIEISKTEFFATVGRMDVHPNVAVATLKDRFHVSMWESRDRRVVGKTVSDSWAVSSTRFYKVAA